ncbi:YtxH domain-containing protein [Spirosoma koreense]
MHFQRRTQPQDYLTEQPYLSGLLTGLIAGLAVGFLFAPRSGKELRKQIAGTVSDQTKEVRHQWDKTKAQAKETVNNIKTNVGLATDKVEDEFNVYVDKATKEARKAEEEADKAVKEAGRLADEAKSAIGKFRDTDKIG